MDTLLYCCCGLDVHKDIIQACILKGIGNDPEPIRHAFGTMPGQLLALREWLVQNDCACVAMESTGVYWRPVFEALEEAPSIEQLFVVNARHMRNLPGRKSDVADAEWIASLFRHGLLSNSFVPDKRIRTLREVSRMKRALVDEHTSYVNRLEKFLQIRGFKLSSVVSSILGVSARSLLDTLASRGRLALSDVERARNGKMKASAQDILLAVSGRLDTFERQILRTYLDKLDSIDREIQVLLELMLELAEPDQAQLQLLDSIPGIDLNAALSILAEIGPSPHLSFRSSSCLCSWAGLVPRNDESAGKIKSRRILHGNPYIKSILCQTAWAAVYSRNAVFHHWFWSHQAKLGRKKAIIAVARKMLALIYSLLLSGRPYDNAFALANAPPPG